MNAFGSDNSTSTPSFGDALVAAGRSCGRLCVGIDPHGALLESWGLGVDVAGLRTFSEICVAAFSGHVALVKPQVAFYEAFGSRGFAVLEETIAKLRAAGTLVLADAKRGDIGSTMAGYARAWLDEASPLAADAVTVSPFLGCESVQPLLDVAKAHNKGVFVLAATSNPEARIVQDHTNEDGLTISQQIVDWCRARNALWGTDGHVGNIGVVVGATVQHPPRLADVNGPVLLPGVGAQGASAEDVARLTAGVEAMSFANVSRAVLQAGPDVSALRLAVAKMVKEF